MPPSGLGAEILAIQDRKVAPVEIPEWGKTLHVRSLTGAERDTMEHALLDATKDGTLKRLGRAIVCVAFACDETGAPLWAPEDAAALADKSAAALNRIRRAGQKLNALRDEDEEALKKN